MRRVRWWLSVASIALVGTAVVQVGAVSAQDSEESTLRVERVDARGDEVVIEGVAPGVDPATIEVTSGDDAVEVTSAATVGTDDLDHEVVAVIDNAEALGNAVVQLAKQGLDPLFPGQGAATTLGVVSTGGQATIDVGPTSSVARLEAGLAGIEPEGGSATWDGIVRAAELLEGRSSRSLGTVVLFSASPATAATSVPARAEAALERAGASLQVIALPMGAEVDTFNRMVRDVGGSVQVISSDAEIAEAYETTAAAISGTFRLTVPALGSPGELVPLTLSAGDASTEVAFDADGISIGSSGLAPIESGGGGFFANGLVKWLSVLLVIVAVLLLAWGVVSLVVPDRSDLGRRLEAYDEDFGVELPPEFADEASNMTVPLLKRAVEFTGDVAERRGFREKVEVMLERANLPLRAPEAMFFTVVAAAIVVVLTFLLTGNLIATLVVGVIAVMLPGGALNFRIRSRQKVFLRQLPDMLTLLAGTLRAGYSIGQGFESVSGEVADPMGRELRRVVSETRLGRSLEESLEAVAERMDSEDFGWAVMAIRIQREVGGNLAELLLTVADTMTQRERLRREVSTLTAEGRISAIIIGGLPPGLAVVMWVMNPDYISVLFSPGLGYLLIGVALVSMVIGFAWMKKTITIEV